MPIQDAKRKQTVVLIADVKGYSRLLGEDEAWAVQTLSVYKEIIIAHVREHKGRFVEAVGDNLLAEFAAVVNAIQCAVEVQKELKTRNAQLPENRRMEFRIGLNLGDVIEEGDKISGDGVNVTVKLESLAAAGEICISGAAYDYVKKKLALKYEYLGEQSVKNIEKPVRVYRVLMEPKGLASRLSVWKGWVVRQWERLNPVLKVIIVLVALVNGVWQLYPLFSGSPLQMFSKGKLVPSSSDKTSKTAQPDPAEIASKEKMAFPLPDVPSIAVLPFVNMSEDPKQEFLCNGMTEQIITVLSKTPGVFVVARDSTFTYKGKPVKVKQVSEELGVRYVVEGSFQRSGDRVRITAQLIDALTGKHVWAERYDRYLKDIFALQDEVTLRVLTAIRGKLTESELSLEYGKYYGGKQGLDCYLKIMEGNDLASRRNIKDNNLARRIAEEALVICPEVPMAYLLMAYVHSNDYWSGSTGFQKESVGKAIELVKKALALDDGLAEAHGLLGYLYTLKRDYENGIAEGERAVALNPGAAIVLGYYAFSLSMAGRSEEAITLFHKSIRLNPFGSFPTCYHAMGNALMFAGRYEEAVSAYKKYLQGTPNYIWAHLMLAATYSIMGREKEAQAEVAEVLSLNPAFSLDFWAKTALVRNQSTRDKIFNALRKAGLK
jgi:adenylate cyclase